jgi:hypothetical protein
MNKSVFKYPLILALVLGLTLPGLSQGRQTGTVAGVVKDDQGEPLSRCTVYLRSDKLQGQNIYYTPDSGLFRFLSLPPGSDYELVAEKPGYKTYIRPGLIVKVGRVTEVAIVLETTSLEEEIVVTAASPAVDTHTAKFTVNYSADFIHSLPINRDLYDIQNTLPGAVADGEEYRRTASILGGTVRSTLYTLDGAPMNDPGTFNAMTNINVDVYDEIEMGLGALPAEIGQTDSAHINIVTKSGANNFSGAISGYYTSDGLSKDLFSVEEIADLNVQRPESFTNYKDFLFTLGGAIMADKVWFFLNGRRLVWDRLNTYSPESRMTNLGIESPHFDLRHEEWLGFFKVTFKVMPNLRYSGLLHYNKIYEPYYQNIIDDNRSEDAVAIWDHENTFTTSHQLNWIFDQNTLMDVRGTYIHRYFPLHHREGTDGNYTSFDKKEQVYWGRIEFDDEYVSNKMLASAVLTKFADDFLGSSHEVKVGAEFEDAKYQRDWFRANPYYSYWMDYAAGDPYYYSSTDRIGLLRIRYCPPRKELWNIEDNVRRVSAYVQDNIKTGRVAFNLGLRFDWSYQFQPNQYRPELRYEYAPELQNPDLGTNDLLIALIDQMQDEGLTTPFDSLTTSWKKVVNFTTFSPRIGLVFDLFGNGKTALKLHFARYYEPVWAAKYNAAQIFDAGSYWWYWEDNNANTLMDLPGTDTYRLQFTTNQDPEYSYYDENLKAPYVNEFLAGLEHELTQDLSIGLHFLRKDNRNIVEDIDQFNGYDPNATDDDGLIWIPYEFVDPGLDGAFGTTDDQALTVYGLREDRPIPEKFGTNPPEAKRQYYAGILTLSKRMSNRWQFEGSVLYSTFKGNVSAQYAETEGESSAFDTPNAQINSYGRLYFDRPWQIKFMASAVLPFDFILSAYFQHLSGSNWTRTLERVYFPPELGVQQSFVWVRAEERGANRIQPYTNLDLRLEKSVRLGENTRLNLLVDIFNLLGQNGINYYENPGGRLWSYTDPPEYQTDPLFGTASNVFGVRSFRLGVRFSF